MDKLKLFLKTHKEEFTLNIREGLIKTTNRGKSIDILKKKFPQIKWVLATNNNSFNLVSTKLNFDLEEVIKYINNLGWFPSVMSYKDKENNQYRNLKFDLQVLENWFENLKWLVINFEAKYDFKIEKKFDTLYHITPLKNYEKIKKIGLSPKSRSKKSYHPERVYLGKNIEDTIELGDLFYQTTGENEWVLLEVKVENLPYIKFYQDPNFSPGLYTLNNIPPSNIKKIKTLKY